jgi:hypothetical protein
MQLHEEEVKTLFKRIHRGEKGVPMDPIYIEGDICFGIWKVEEGGYPSDVAYLAWKDEKGRINHRKIVDRIRLDGLFGGIVGKIEGEELVITVWKVVGIGPGPLVGEKSVRIPLSDLGRARPIKTPSLLIILH